MKLFTKLFSGIMLILAVSLGFAEYYTVYRTFDTTLEHEKDNALRKHQLVKYALQADMVSAENLEMLDETTLQELVDRKIWPSIKRGAHTYRSNLYRGNYL